MSQNCCHNAVAAHCLRCQQGNLSGKRHNYLPLMAIKKRPTHGRKLKPGLETKTGSGSGQRAAGCGQLAGGTFKCHPHAVAASVAAAAVLQTAEGFMFLQNAPRRLTSDPTKATTMLLYSISYAECEFAFS